jgi:hypothetical protein
MMARRTCAATTADLDERAALAGKRRLSSAAIQTKEDEQNAVGASKEPGQKPVDEIDRAIVSDGVTSALYLQARTTKAPSAPRRLERGRRCVAFFVERTPTGTWRETYVLASIGGAAKMRYFC